MGNVLISIPALSVCGPGVAFRRFYVNLHMWFSLKLHKLAQWHQLVFPVSILRWVTWSISNVSDVCLFRDPWTSPQSVSSAALWLCEELFMTGSRHPGSFFLVQSRTLLKYVHVCIYVHTYKPFFSTLLYKRYQDACLRGKESLYCTTLTSVNRSILFPIQKHLSIFPSSSSRAPFAHGEFVTDRWASAILSRPVMAVGC